MTPDRIRINNHGYYRFPKWEGGYVRENLLSDYEIAINFGDTLQIIYKAKMEELNQLAEPMYAHLDRLAIPQVSEFEREFAGQVARLFYGQTIEAIEHIQKIRNIYKKMKKDPEVLNIDKSRNVPIDSIYDFKRKGKNVSCPFHPDLHPSASIKYNKLVCFSCGVKMDGIALFMALNKVSFKDAVKTLSN